MNSTYDMAS